MFFSIDREGTLIKFSLHQTWAEADFQYNYHEKIKLFCVGGIKMQGLQPPVQLSIGCGYSKLSESSMYGCFQKFANSVNLRLYFFETAFLWVQLQLVQNCCGCELSHYARRLFVPNWIVLHIGSNAVATKIAAVAGDPYKNVVHKFFNYIHTVQ